MSVNSSRPARNKLIAAALLMVILSTVFFILQRGRSDNPPPVDSIVPTAQSNQRKVSDPDSQNKASVSEKPTPEPESPRQTPRETHAAVPSESPALIRVNGALQQARLIYRVDPVLPETVKEYDQIGSVELDVTVNEKGTVTEAVVARIMANMAKEEFAEAALTAVGQWRYEPALIDGIPTPVNFGVTIHFNRDGTFRTAGKPVYIDPSIFFNSASSPWGPDGPIGPSGLTRDGHPVLHAPAENYNGREYYAATSGMSAPAVQVDLPLLEAMANTGWPQDVSLGLIIVTIYINENGGIDGIRRSGPRIPSLEEELLKNIRVISPADANGKGVPSFVMISISPV